MQIARDAVRARYTSDAGSHVRSIYHTLRPHNALSPLPIDEASSLIQDENECGWSQLLVGAIMPLLLPPEDLLNPCLDVLVTEIFSELIVHKAVLGRASEPWLLWEGITKVMRLRLGPPRDLATSPTSRLEQFGLLTTAGITKEDVPHIRAGTVDAAISAFWFVVRCTLLAWTYSSVLVMTLVHASSLPPRSNRVSREVEASDKARLVADGHADGPPTAALTEERPIVSMRVWSCVEQITSLQRRMPWLTGGLSLLQWLSLCGPGPICRTNSTLDR